MRNKLLVAFLCLLLHAGLHAQVDSVEVFVDSAAIDDGDIVVSANTITNTSSLKLFFEKLYLLEQQKAGKINIVHIGDSHIQADIMTGVIRKSLQEKFGNGGAGFSFPHSLVKTNGSPYIRYSSNVGWTSRRNIYPVDGSPVGLSGIALSTTKNFAIEINVRDSAYTFNTLKIITPSNASLFEVATSSKTIVLESTVPKKIINKIKSGDVLGSIAAKYNVTITQLKKANGLKSNNIRAGRTLKIPTGEMQARQVKKSEFIPVPLTSDSLSHNFYSKEALSKIYLLPDDTANRYSLNGLIFEKDDAGILYHSIGVNGAKCSDYNKYPLFFEQLPALQPDLVIISLGTNETFDKMVSVQYMTQLNEFIANVKKYNPDVCIIVMTPPPSLFKRRYPNTFAADYARDIQINETAGKYASWDLFDIMGGLFSVNRNAKEGLMSSDKVHYSHDGYKKKGALFTEAFIQAYNNFKNNRD